MNEPATTDATSGGDSAATAPRDQQQTDSATDRAGGRADGQDTAAPNAPHPVSNESEHSSAEPSARGAGQAHEGGTSGSPGTGARKRRRRRGGRGRGQGQGGDGRVGTGGSSPGAGGTSAAGTSGPGGSAGRRPRTQSGEGDAEGGGRTDQRVPADGRSARAESEPDELPKPAREGRPSADDAAKGLVRTPEAEREGERGASASTGSDRAGTGGPAGKPRIGDTRPAPEPSAGEQSAATGSKGNRDRSGGGSGGGAGQARKRRRRGGRGRSSTKAPAKSGQGRESEGVRSGVAKPVTALTGGEAIELDEDVLEERRGRTRNGKPVGRYLMAVHVQPEATQISILEGRSLIEHYVARPSDDITQIHGNIYLGRVQNVLPGMEAAFLDIGTPKNAVLYRGDLHFDAEDIEERDDARIEQLLQPRQTVLCQVTKNPIMHKGARLTQEVSLPGRFVVLVPNSRTLGISKRLPDAERKRLRKIVDRARPEGHGVIVRTAAESITGPEIERDLARLVAQWEKIDALAKKASAPALLYREPDMALRVIREEFSKDFRSVVIDDKDIFDDVHDYVASVSPALAERVSYFDASTESLPLFEQHHIMEQLRRALDRKVWLPSGGSLIIEHTEALTVIDVNTGKNVGKSSLEETVFANNLEAAVEIARQLRLRDVGGIIVIDFVDMEVKKNRAEVVRVFREALARDKTRTQVFDISELGLVQMTRKRIGEGLLESFSEPCATCEGRGVVFDRALFDL
jgi:ribonuclease E